MKCQRETDHHQSQTGWKIPGILKSILKPKIFIFLIALIYITTLSNNLYPFEDNAVYLILAKSLAIGQGYSRIDHPDNFPHLKFPPIFPALLSLIYLIFGMKLLFFKIISLSASIISLYLLYLLFKKESNHWLAFITLVLTAFNPLIFIFSHSIMTEILYLLFSILILLVFREYSKKDVLFHPYFFILVFLLIISILTRPISFSLVVSIGLYYLVDSIYSKRIIPNFKKLFSLLALISIPTFLWIIRGVILKPIENINQAHSLTIYLSTFLTRDLLNPSAGTMSLLDIPSKILENIYNYLGIILISDFQKMGTPLSPSLIYLIILLGFVFWTVIIIGFFKISSRKSLLPFYIITYLFVILIDSWVTVRYLVPIIPFLLFYFINGLDYLSKKFFSEKLVKKIFLGFVIIILILSSLGCIIEVNRQHRKPYYQNEWGEFYQMSGWIKDNIKEGIFISKKCATFYIWTEKKCSNYLFTTNQSAVLDFLKQRKADYIIIDNFSYNTSQRYLQPVIEDNPRQFQLVHIVGQTRLYKTNFSTSPS